MIATLVVCLTMFASDEEKPNPPPALTAEQLGPLRILVQQTQSEQAAIRNALMAAQEELARCYSEYELNVKQVEKLQTEIMEQQRKLLASHHRMQTELRTIVSEARFRVLSRRIENALRDQSLKDTPAPTSQPSTK